MRVSKTVGRSVVALAIALAPMASIAFGTADVAFAKGGNGGGGGNGNGNGGGNGKGGGNGNGGGNSNGGSHGKGHSTSGKQDKAGKSNRDAGDVLKSLFTRGTETRKTIKSAKNPKAGSIAIKSKSVKNDIPGLSSLKRNYRAYLNSNDPRMAAISAYVIAYAEFEAEFGPDAVPTDPALSDEALREALESFTKEGVVTDDALIEAKDILGVGPAVGKIDQIRETFPEEPADTELEVSE